MIDAITNYLDLIITGAITGLLGWFFKRKKLQAETEKVESDVLAAIQANYATMVKDMKDNYAELKAKVDLLELEVAEWKQKYYELKKTVDETH